MTDVLEVSMVEKVQELQNESYAKGFADGKEEGLRVARQDRPIGHWNWSSLYGNTNLCSICDFRVRDKSNYCPNCGAKMVDS